MCIPFFGQAGSLNTQDEAFFKTFIEYCLCFTALCLHLSLQHN